MSEVALQAPPLEAPAWTVRLRRGWTGRLDDLRLALDSLSSHKLRSGLTLLGIVIGVFTVVAMMALLNGLRKSIDKQLGELGANAFQIQREPAVQFGQLSPEIQARKKLTLTHVRQLRELLPQAKEVGGQLWEYGKTASANGNTDLGVQVSGGTPEFFTLTNLALASGRGYTEGEVTSGARVAVIGAAVIDSLFPGQDPIGRKIKLGRMDLEIIGTIERQGGIPIDTNPDNTVSVPISLFMELYGTSRSVAIAVMAPDPDSMKRVQDQAIAAFRKVRGLDTAKENDFEVVSNDSMRASARPGGPRGWTRRWRCGTSDRRQLNQLLNQDVRSGLAPGQVACGQPRGQPGDLTDQIGSGACALRAAGTQNPKRGSPCQCHAAFPRFLPPPCF